MILDFEKDYVLENDRIKLLPLIPEHYNDLLTYSENEPEIWSYSTLHSSAAGKDNLKDYLILALSAKEKRTEYPFAVFDKLSGKIAGSTRFYNIQQEQKTLEIGYTWYGKDFQGTGINKNCKYLLLEFAFESLLMERVGFIADSNNQKSIAAMKSIGCVEEGILRSNMLRKNGSRRDSVVLSILKDEWLGEVKNKLFSKI